MTEPLPFRKAEGGGSSSERDLVAKNVIVLAPDVLNADGTGMHVANVDQNGTFALKQLPPFHYRAYAFSR